MKQVREQFKGLPTVIQSSEIHNSHRAFELKSVFIDKNSETLTQDIETLVKTMDQKINDFDMERISGLIVSLLGELENTNNNLNLEIFETPSGGYAQRIIVV